MRGFDSISMTTALIDWCITAYLVTHTYTLCVIGVTSHTQAYSPPEVLDQDNSDDIVEVSPKADVWALGE
jgi:serine/threonine protein kinase